jgi:hypothetical protein
MISKDNANAGDIVSAGTMRYERKTREELMKLLREKDDIIKKYSI